MKSIVVTGGAGRIGRLVVEDLLEHGYEVLATDRVEATDLPCRFQQIDLADAAAVSEVLKGADAVVHLGAIPGPGAPEPMTFHNNVMSTYNVVDAALALGLQKLVFASTVFALGWVRQAELYLPEYVPVDEAHPLTPFEAYGLSKQIGEDICAMASRRSAMPSVSLRFMNVIQPAGYSSLPRPMPQSREELPFVMWAYVDARDAARSCRLALEAETSGHEAMFIAAKDIRFDCTTRDLMQRLAPDVEIRGSLEGSASVVNIQKARDLIGYTPHHSCRPEAK
jgi:nucleoside-diphosphate-sugar epimerase